MKVTFIRHGATQGNLEKRYIGITNESLCLQGINALKQKKKFNKYPNPEKIVVSPMIRCMETAKIIYPSQELFCCNLLKECDFGEFENKNYIELSENRYYQKWVDSNGALPFPNGESIEGFKIRCLKGFHECLQNFKGFHIVFIVHGGTIMAILEKYAVPPKGYYDWSVANGCGFMAEWNGKDLLNLFHIG